MPNYQDMIHRVGKLDGDFITVHHERCVLVRNCNADCLRCAKVCTSGCISFDGEELSIDTSRCIGCGSCATACPTCCLEAHHPNDAELLAACYNVAKAHDGHVCIACANAEGMENIKNSTSDVARVECLGRIEESLLMNLAAAGFSVTLVHNRCRLCPHVTGRRLLQEVLETREKLLDAWGVSAKCEVPHELPWLVCAPDTDTDAGIDTDANADSDSSQQDLSCSNSQEQENIAQSYSEQPEKDPNACGVRQENESSSNANHQEKELHFIKVMKDGTLPHFVPDRRERLLDSLAELGTPRDVILETRLWGHVIIDTETCMSCRMCSVFCPTGALARFDNEDGTFGVEHYCGDCIKCRECTTICPTGALVLSDEVKAQDLLTGLTDTYTMKPLEVVRSQAHTIRDMAKTYTGGTQVYER